MVEIVQLQVELENAKKRIKHLEDSYEIVLKTHHEELYFMSEQMEAQRIMMQDLLNYSNQLMNEINKLKQLP